MATLDKNSIKEILNLQSPLIGLDIAERQLEVIRRGFNHLYQEDQNILYIADEVGLGKTYIAIGIASLLRHFSSNPGNYQDVIIVPKGNLQQKWEKEIKQFINHNYLIYDNRVKSVIGAPVGEIRQKQKLEAIAEDHPAYHLYRNSQFSLGFNWRENKNQQLETMLNKLTNESAKAIFITAIQNRITSKPKSYIKKLYAYLLSVCNPEIELLIIDEGHNFKQGLGNSNEDEVSDRNNVVTRFLGIPRKTEEDKEIFNDYPDLKRLVKPKVKKLIILSATPKTTSLKELKYQLDCFVPHHILSDFKTEEEIKEKLPYFLIRGNMEYFISGETYTRNLCRHEHRTGNVEKLEDAPALKIKDDEQAIVLGLLQYNTVKHLNAKNNATFELGMLAGFETFEVDQVKRAKSYDVENTITSEAPEYEEVRTKKIRQSQDYEVVKRLIDSYKKEFGCLPPHPKQDAIVDAAFQMMKRGEKSLIFVRRVASAFELERRMVDKWELAIAEEFKNKWLKSYSSKELQQLIGAFEDSKLNREVLENLDRIFSGLINKLQKLSFSHIISNVTEEHLRTGLQYLFSNRFGVSEIEEWYKEIQRHAKLSIIKNEFVQNTYDLLERNYEVWLEAYEDGKGADIDEEVEESYFFHNYFKQNANKSFRNKLYKTDLLDANYFRINEHFKLASFNVQALNTVTVNKQIRSKNELREVQEYFIKSMEEDEYKELLLEYNELHPLLIKTTLITELLIKLCESELKEFIDLRKNKTKALIIEDLSQLFTIIKSILRNGSGFLPLYVADKSNQDIITSYLSILSNPESLFHLTLVEIKTIINDYSLIRAVNFPESDKREEIQIKLKAQTPVIGLSGESKRRSTVATQFRMPGFPYVLITTDIFREGEDLHTYCQNIYHYGIAWNCSDMEQRTGRVDRINSISHRKMLNNCSVKFNERVHVFYPFIQQTLEVNQVNKLFHSINSFVETFNDFTEAVIDDGTTTTSEVIEDLPKVLVKPLRSKFEHHNFKGYDNLEKIIVHNPVLGMQKSYLIEFLQNLQLLLSKKFSFHYPPELDEEKFEIKGDLQLVNRMNRRGPFVIQLKNHICPGEFCFKLASHIFKSNTRIQRAVEEHSQFFSDYEFDSIGEYHALSIEIPIDQYSEKEFLDKFTGVIESADAVEEELSKGGDLLVFSNF